MQKQADESLSPDSNTCIDSNYAQKVLALFIYIA